MHLGGRPEFTLARQIRNKFVSLSSLFLLSLSPLSLSLFSLSPKDAISLGLRSAGGGGTPLNERKNQSIEKESGSAVQRRAANATKTICPAQSGEIGIHFHLNGGQFTYTFPYVNEFSFRINARTRVASFHFQPDTHTHIDIWPDNLHDFDGSFFSLFSFFGDEGRGGGVRP